MIKGCEPYVRIKADTHQYFDPQGTEYMSVSKFIGLFYKKFDSNLVSGMVAKSEGVSKQSVIDKWDGQTQEGTRKHDALEYYFKTTQIKPENADLTPMILNIASQYKEYYRVYNEVILYDKDNLIAGTADLPLVCTSSYKSVIDIGDFKNYNRGINQKEVNSDGKPRNDYMLHCLSHLQNSSYNKLCLQLSTYAYFMEKMTGRKIGKLFGHWISPTDPLINKIIPIPYMKYEVIEMIKWKNENPIPMEPAKSILSPSQDWDI